MKIRRMFRAATLLWGAYRVYSRSRRAVRVNAKQVLRRARRSL